MMYASLVSELESYPTDGDYDLEGLLNQAINAIHRLNGEICDLESDLLEAANEIADLRERVSE